MTETVQTFDSPEAASSGPTTAGVITVAIAGLAVALVARSRLTGSRAADRRAAALTAYLREHLSGSDAALQVVEKLHRSDVADDGFFGTLLKEFREEREVVRRLLTALDASSVSVKRLAAQAAAPILRASSGGARGDMSLFRTLEGLAVGVQGKRCLWRALQSLQSRLPSPSHQSYADLEAQAVRQWEALEQRRLSLVPDTFSVSSADANAGAFRSVSR